MKCPDAKIAMLACKLGVTAHTPDADGALLRLRQLREHADWMLAEDIESFIRQHFREIGKV
jgi:hypothetical protein